MATALQPPFPWLRATLGAAALVMGAVGLWRVPGPPKPAAEARGTAPLPLQLRGVGAAGDQSLLHEELLLQDPAPLFLPTIWNSGQATLRVDLQREPSVRLGGFPAQLEFSDDDPAIHFPAVTAQPADASTMVDALAGTPAFRGLSRRALGLPPLPERAAWLEISTAGSGQPVIREQVPVGGRASPRPSTVGGGDLWAPVELLVAVDATGVVGRPSVVATSGFEAIDIWALDILLRHAQLGGRLAPGFYRVVLGP